MILFLLLLFVAFMLWLMLQPAWLPRPPQNRMTAALTRQAAQAQREAGSWLNRWPRPFRRRGEPSAQQFRDWLAGRVRAGRPPLYDDVAEVAAFTLWLEGRSESEALAFTRRLAAQCQSLNFDLAWLADATVEGDLRQAVEETALHSGLALWRSSDVEALAAFKAWQAAPGKRQNRALGNRLYARLAEAGLVETPSELLLAPDRERRAHVTQSIQAVAAEQPDAFQRILKAVVAELAAPPAASSAGEKSAGAAEAGTPAAQVVA